MDKRQVIQAYKRGLITIQECAQILGMQPVHLYGMMEDGQTMLNKTAKQADGESTVSQERSLDAEWQRENRKLRQQSVNS
ncbi:hypothetical protein [Marinicrinis sediminis]|uniref:Resolvase HTH domain-containing protein n=1 Tax=Marinicrinis sediminis TaxID=1652465 RepID=A0ABW5RES7_9BACL